MPALKYLLRQMSTSVADESPAIGLDELSFAVISLLDLIVSLGASVGRDVSVANDEKGADLSGDADTDTVAVCGKQGTSLTSHTQHEDDGTT